MEILLKYLGKKRCVIDNKFLSKPFNLCQEPVWVSNADASWLVSTNPKMFSRIGERDTPTVEPQRDQEDTHEKREGFECQICGRKFSSERWYKNHIAGCKADAGNADHTASIE